MLFQIVNPYQTVLNISPECLSFRRPTGYLKV